MEMIVIAVVLAFAFVRLSRRGGAAPVPTARGPVGWVPTARWAVVRPLARADLRRVLLHPAFLVGVLLTPLMLLSATEYASTWRDASAGVALALVPLGWLTIVATNLVALRPLRTGADELFGTLPAPAPVRTTAMLATAVGPVAMAALFAAAWVVFLSNGYWLRGDALTGGPEWKEMGVGVLIVAGSVCVGVSVARWLRHPGFGVLAVIATVLLQVRFLDVTTWPWTREAGDPLRFLAFIAEGANTSAQFLEFRPSGWHLLYIAALVVVMAGVALARDGVRTPVAAVLGGGLLVTAGAGWMQTRPLPDQDTLELVAALTDPSAHQVCEELGGVRYCAYEEYHDDIPLWREVVEDTTALLPAPNTEGPRLSVIQRAPQITSSDDCTPMAFEETLPPGVAARLSPGAVWPADGHIHPGFEEESFPCSDRRVRGFFLAVQTAAAVVGLPSAPHHDFIRCTADGQARAAVALWAGAAATPEGTATLRDVIASGSDGTRLTFGVEWDSPPMWGVEYLQRDADLALMMVNLPPTAVRAELARDWGRWSDPRSSSADLAEALGVEGGADVAPPASGGCR